MNEIALRTVDRLDLAFEPKPWAFAHERRAEIDDFFAAMQRENPAFYNGRVLLMHRHELKDGTLRGGYFETDYASFLTWIRWGAPDPTVCDCFGAGAIVTADGAVLLGVMGAHTASAGQIYFPAGTPGPEDIVDGKVDLDVSIRREITEETGLLAGEFAADPGWTVIREGWLMIAIRTLRSPYAAVPLRARILDWMARQRQPELADIVIVRGPDDFRPAMRRFVTAFLTRHFGRDRN